MTQLLERGGGNPSVRTADRSVDSPSPFEKVYLKAEEDLEAIFSQEGPVVSFYEVPFQTAIYRRDLLRSTVGSLVDNWGPEDKEQLDDNSHLLFRNGKVEDMIGRAYPQEGRVEIALLSDKEAALENLRTVMGPVTSGFVGAEIAERMDNDVRAANARQVQAREYLEAVKPKEPGFRVKPARTFYVEDPSNPEVIVFLETDAF